VDLIERGLAEPVWADVEVTFPSRHDCMGWRRIGHFCTTGLASELVECMEKPFISRYVVVRVA
jgi:hypothetical protein